MSSLSAASPRLPSLPLVDRSLCERTTASPFNCSPECPIKVAEAKRERIRIGRMEERVTRKIRDLPMVQRLRNRGTNRQGSCRGALLLAAGVYGLLVCSPAFLFCAPVSSEKEEPVQQLAVETPPTQEGAFSQNQATKTNDKNPLPPSLRQESAGVPSGSPPEPPILRRGLQQESFQIQVDELWTYCDGFQPKLFENVEVTINPNPPKAGQWMTVTVKAQILKAVQNPIIQTSFVLNNLIPFAETRHYCQTNSCPVVPGPFTAKEAYYILPFVAGEAKGVAKVIEAGTEELLVCVNIGPLGIGN